MTDLAILLVVILIFALMFRGPKTLPKIGGMFGRGVKQIREEAAELTGSRKHRRTGPRPAAQLRTGAQLLVSARSRTIS